MTRIWDELFTAPARAVLAGALLLPVEALGLALSGTLPRSGEWWALLTALVAVAAVGEACALVATTLLARRFGRPGRAASQGWRGQLARLHRPLLAWAVFGLADTTLGVPAAVDPFLSACAVASAVVLARALLPAGVVPRVITVGGVAALALTMSSAPRGLDGFGPQRLLTHARGAYPLAHRALHGAVLWRRERLVLALDRERPGEAHRLLADRTTLERQLDQLRALTLRLRAGHAEHFGPEDVRLPEAAPALAELLEASRDEDLQDVVARLGLELSLLERTVDALAHDESSAAAHAVTTVAFPEGRGAQTVQLPAAATWLELSNTGATPLVEPRLLVDGTGGWHDLAALVEPLAEAHAEPSARALALWEFLVERWQHGEPPHSADELHDPVKLFNVWGYGFCDDVARAYVVLARALDLPARLWALEGHVVAEAWYDGAWHMFDADGGVHYRDPRGEVLSVVALCEDPQQLEWPVLAPGLAHARYAPDVLKPVFASAHDNHLADVWTHEPSHAMGFVLQPGERIRWSLGPGGLRFADRFFRRPERLANGTWTRQAEWTAGEPEQQLTFELPYPVLAGRVHVDGALDGLEVRRPGGAWVPLSSAPAPGGGVVASLEGFLRNGWGDPDYALVLRLTGASDAARAVRVELTFQHAPDAWPEMAPGRHELELQHGLEAGPAQVRIGVDAAG